jgi:phosphate/sulfate permease
VWWCSSQHWSHDVGNHILKALGNRLNLQSPSRGLSIKLGAMFTVMVFSCLGMPISAMHSMTGATTGVNLCNSYVRAVNWKLLVVIFCGWVITCPASGVMTGLVFLGITTSP